MSAFAQDLYFLAAGESPGESFTFAAFPVVPDSDGLFAASTGVEAGDTYEPVPGSQSPNEATAGSFTWEDGGRYRFTRQAGWTGTVSIDIRYRDASAGVTSTFTFPLVVTDSVNDNAAPVLGALALVGASAVAVVAGLTATDASPPISHHACLVPQGTTPAPTAAQLRDQTYAQGSPLFRTGDALSGVQQSLAWTGRAAETPYDVHWCAEDAQGNLSAVVSQTFTTLAVGSGGDGIRRAISPAAASRTSIRSVL